MGLTVRRIHYPSTSESVFFLSPKVVFATPIAMEPPFERCDCNSNETSAKIASMTSPGKYLSSLFGRACIYLFILTTARYRHHPYHMSAPLTVPIFPSDGDFTVSAHNYVDKDVGVSCILHCSDCITICTRTVDYIRSSQPRTSRMLRRDV